MPIMKVPDTGVTVRMYRAGLGDCFLLAFRGKDRKPVYMLIDCGIHSQYKGGSDIIKEIAQHVSDSTNGHLHVLVMTHEHGDHISGFHLAQGIFRDMDIDEGWFAWTEDPENGFARRIDRARSLMLRGLNVAGPALKAAGDPAAKNIKGLTDFFVIGDEKFGVSSRDTRDLIRGLPKDRRYLKPKMPPLTLPGVDGVRIFVLGPPEDERMLMRARPSSRGGEVYRDDDHALALDDTLSAAFLAAADTEVDSGDRRRAEGGKPFASNLRLAKNTVKANEERYEFFHAHYGFDPKDLDAWRRVDSDWQLPAESLALKLDAATNNTSLVLAIELQNTGRVLLFAADAQVGNWQSWHEGGWSEANGLKKDETLTAEELLRRTVLYKVGHHGSHNATLREKGLEMMTSPELAAMIPVDSEWAFGRKPHPWRMPFDPLYEDLVRRTGSRILRSDVGLVKPTRETSDWTKFKDRVAPKEPFYPGLKERPVDPLYLDLKVSDHNDA